MESKLIFEFDKLLSLAHKIYVSAAYDEDWVAMIIAWRIISNLEK